MQGKKGTKKERPATMTVRLKNVLMRQYLNEIINIRNISQNDCLNEIIENYIKRSYTKTTGKLLK